MSNSTAEIIFGKTSNILPRSYAQFHHFFPQWNAGLQAVLALNCSAPIQQYYNVSNTVPGTAYGVISCLLGTMPNYRQQEMSMSSVVLGLTPQLIQVLGPTTLQTSIVSIKRPFLAFLLCVGSPTIRPLFPGSYVRELRDLKQQQGWYPKQLSDEKGLQRLVGLVQYLLALAPSPTCRCSRTSSDTGA